MASLNPLQGALGHRNAAHLLRRTTFKFTKPRIDQMAGQSASAALDAILKAYPLQMEQPVFDDVATTDVVENATWCLPLPGTTDVNLLPAQDFVLRRWVLTWFTNELYKDEGIRHKMAFFYHQFMVVHLNTLRSNTYFDYLQLLQWGALGNFKKLAAKMIMDNCMINYLNTQQNIKTNPNENFAREFFELFTIGKGPQAAPGDYTNYTEDDIAAAARIFTGIKARVQRDLVDQETGVPRGTINFTQHDTGPKQFSPRFQNTVIQGAANVAGFPAELAAFVDMVFAQPETAKNLCRRLYRYFVGPNISDEIEQDIIAPLSSLLISSNWEVLPVLRKLLESQHFYDLDDSDNKDEIVGSMIKSPMELIFQPMHFFSVPMPDPATQILPAFNVYNRVILGIFTTATFPLLQPSDVAGYPAYYQEPDFTRVWFSSSSIIARYKWPQQLLTGKAVYGGNPNASIGIKLNIVPWVKNSGITADPSDGHALVTALLKYMLPEEVDNDRFNYFYNTVFLDNLPAADWTYEWQTYLSTNNEAEVKIALERLINAIMYSPEYQTF